MTLKRVIPLVLVLAILAAGLWYVRSTDQADQMNIRDVSALAEPLQREKQALEEERDNLETEYSTLMRDVSTVQLLFRELDASLFTEVYPLMRDRGITGVMGLSLHEYPGYSKYKIPREHFDRLVMDGWGTCYMYESDHRLDSWFRYMDEKLEKDGIARPTAIYFPDNSYDPEMDVMLMEHGITTVIVNAEDGHSSTITRVGTMWYTGAMPWNYTGVTSDTELLGLTNGGNLTFTISFNSLWDAYEQESLVKILDIWESYQVIESPLELNVLPTPTPTPVPTGADSEAVPYEYQLKITSYEKARAAHLAAAESEDSLMREKLRREAELTEQIDSLNAQIEGIFAQWGKG